VDKDPSASADDAVPPGMDGDHEEPTEPMAEEPTDPIRVGEEQKTEPGMPDLSREEPTVPREAPTLRLERGAPWSAGGPASSHRTHDPLFLPVVVFVAVMVTCIGVFVYTQTHKPPPPLDPTLAAPTTTVPPPVVTTATPSPLLTPLSTGPQAPAATANATARKVNR
jgi:hypothetical protein